MKAYFIIAAMIAFGQYSHAQTLGEEVNADAAMTTPSAELNDIDQSALSDDDFAFHGGGGGGGFHPGPSHGPVGPIGHGPVGPIGHGPVGPIGHGPIGHGPIGHGPIIGPHAGPHPWGPRPGNWHFYEPGWHPFWWNAGIEFPLFVWDATVPVGYFQCTSYNSALQAFTEFGPDLISAQYDALSACGGADYEASGCYIPLGYCQLR